MFVYELDTLFLSASPRAIVFHFKYHFYCGNLEQSTLFCVWKVEVLDHYWDQLLHFKIHLFIYSAVSDLSYDTLDLCCRMLDLSLHWNFSPLVLMWSSERVGSVVAMHRPSCPVACGVSVPQPEIKLMSPALEGEFLTTGPLGKTSSTYYILFYSDTERKKFSAIKFFVTPK